jgi:ATP-binding cassette subfamily B protein
VAALTATVLVDAALQVGAPQIVGRFIDAVLGGAEGAAGVTGAVGAEGAAGVAGAALPLVAAFVSIALGRRFLAILNGYLAQDLRWRGTNRLRNDLIRHSLRLPLSYYDRTNPSTMIERIDGDADALSSFFSTFISHTAAGAAVLLGTVAVLFIQNPIIGGTFALAIIAAFWAYRSSAPIAVPRWKRERSSATELYGYLEERLSAREDIRANGAVEHSLKGFEAKLRSLYESSRAAALYGSISFAATWAIFGVNEGLSLAAALILYDAHSLSVGTVYLVLHYSAMVIRPLEQVSKQLRELQGATANLIRVDELLHEPTEAYGPGTANSADTASAAGSVGSSGFLSGGIRFDSVSFSYDGRTPVLKDIGFSLEAGQSLGILGRTGSGKTTLARLLLRLYPLEKGRILLQSNDLGEGEGEGRADGGDRGEGWIDAAELPLPQLRGSIGLVTQEVQLFRGTVRENLTLFGESSEDQKLRDALGEMGLGDWFGTLPEGLDTALSNTAAGFSAGQAQLFALARMSLRNPAILVLDEASARLDPSTSRSLDRAIRRISAGRTLILIAHRLSTLEQVDRVLLLEEGRVAEEGPRWDLEQDRASKFHALLKAGIGEVLA